MNIKEGWDYLSNKYLKDDDISHSPSIIGAFYLVVRKLKLFKIKTSIILAGLLLSSISILAQSNAMSFDYLTSDDGLPDNRIEVMYRDSKDYLWIGTTHNGLSKFDGSKITNYEHIDNEPGSISDNGIYCIYEDSKDNLWIGTWNGLNLYNRKTNSFTAYMFSTPDTVYHQGNFVTSILEDKKGNLWVTYNTDGNNKIGLVKWDFENNTSTQYLIENPDSNYYTNRMMDIGEDSKGRLWVITRGAGIYQFYPDNGQFRFYSDPDKNTGNRIDKCMHIDHNDNIWIGTVGNGLFSFDPSSLKFRQLGINKGNKATNHHYISDIIQPDSNHLFVASDQGGINILNLNSMTFEFITQNDKDKQGLNTNGILSLFFDREKILWVGTTRGGVNYYNPKKSKFKLFERNDKNPNSLSYNIVGSLFEDSEGVIWVGTDGGGLNTYDPRTGEFKVFKHDPDNPNSISGNVIRSVVEDEDKNIWIGTWDAGLNRYSRETGKFYHYLPDENDPSSISSKTSWNLKVDHNNNLWVDVFDMGLEIFNKDDGVVKRFNAEDSDSLGWLTDNFVWLIYEDWLNNIWLCKTDGLFLYDSISNTFTVFNNFPDNDISSFCRDKEGKLWAGSTNKGLFLFDMDGNVKKTYDKSNGLVDNTVQAIVEDDYGNLWISTNKGISHFNQETQKFRNYTESDGLQGNTFFQQSFLKARNGEIYFGGYKGFNSFHPDSIKDNDFIPRVYLTGLKIFNKPVSVGAKDSLLKYDISETKELTLSWRHSVFSLEYSAINYTHADENEYAYMMEGFEKDWNYVGNKKNATYTNLDAGEYVFKVIASNNDGVWNEEGVQMKIIVLPPFWRTWWFRALYILSALGAILLFMYWRFYQLEYQKKHLEIKVKERTDELLQLNTVLEERQEEISMQNEELSYHREQLEQKVKERTNDLEKALNKAEESDKLKSAFLANMSHEIRTPMNAIVGFSHLLKSDDLKQESKNKYIDTIHKNCDSLLVLIDDILDLSRIQANQIAIIKEPFNVVELMRDIESVYKLNSEYKIDIICDIPIGLNDYLINNDVVRVNQVLQNLINNALKFTEKGHVRFGFTLLSDDKINFFVEDTGVGIDPAQHDEVFMLFSKIETDPSQLRRGAGLGLAICKRIAELMDGKLDFESEPGKGTTFNFTIPLEYGIKFEIEENSEPNNNEQPKEDDKAEVCILIAEDEPANYLLVESILFKYNVDITWAKNGQQAVDCVKKRPNDYHLILMDIKMPIINGDEAYDEILKINSAIPAIAITAYAYESEKLSIKNHNFFDYIVKPFNPEAIIQSIEDAIGMTLTRN